MMKQHRQEQNGVQKKLYFQHPRPPLVEILWGLALWGGTGLDTPGRLWGWALQGDLGLGTPGTLWGWALHPGTLWVGHSRETLGLGTPTETWG